LLAAGCGYQSLNRNGGSQKNDTPTGTLSQAQKIQHPSYMHTFSQCTSDNRFHYTTPPNKRVYSAKDKRQPRRLVKLNTSVQDSQALFVGEKNCADVERLKAQHPKNYPIVCPEYKPELIKSADYAIGTGEMHKLIKVKPERHYYIGGTELGFFQRMETEAL
jgi:hypothetical protein